MRTKRLELVAADEAMTEAERFDRTRFSHLLGARIPAEWPPESLIDALAVFHLLIHERPDLRGWLAWYALLPPDEPGASASPLLVAGGGFKGGPDPRGMVEIGYSVLPAYRRRGIATEIVGALVAWAFAHPTVHGVEAETAPENRASRRVLEKCGFRRNGQGSEGGLRFECMKRRPRADE